MSARRLGRALLSSAGAGLGSLILRLVSIAILSRLIGADSFGQYFLGQSVALLLSVVGNLSASYAVMETGHLSRARFFRHLLQPAAVTTLLVGVAAFLPFAVGGASIVAMIGWGGVAVALSAPAMSSLRSAEALGRRLLQFRHLARVEIVATAVGFLIVAPALALGGVDAVALVAAHWTYVLLKLALVLAGGRSHLPSDLAEGAPVLSRSDRRNAYGLEVLDMTAVHVTRLIVGLSFGDAVAALWARAMQLILLTVNLLMQPVGYVLLPLALRDSRHRDRLEGTLPAIVDQLAALALPVTLSVLVASREIALVLLGQDWIGAADYLRAFAPLLLARSVQRAFGMLGRATQTSGPRLLIDAAALLTFAAVVALVPDVSPLATAWLYAASATGAALAHFACGAATRSLPLRLLASGALIAGTCWILPLLDALPDFAVLRFAVLAAIWGVFAALCVVSAKVGRPFVDLAAFRSFGRSMESDAIR